QPGRHVQCHPEHVRLRGGDRSQPGRGHAPRGGAHALWVFHRPVIRRSRARQLLSTRPPPRGTFPASSNLRNEPGRFPHEVLMAELFNSALETLFRGLDESTKARVWPALDIAAGAVLLASIAAAVVGSIVFLQRLSAAFPQ